MLTGANVIIATAERERDELVAGGVEEGKIALRRNGVEVPEKLPERGEFRKALAIRPEEKLLLFLGRLSQKKSPDLLLKAFEKLRHAGPGESKRPHLAFVGPDESGMRGKLEAMAKQLNVAESVHFCPPLGGERKWSAYRDADIFILPSQNENFGNTAAEAVAAGTPVVVTEQCGIASYLKDVAGLIVKHEEGELRRALEQLLEDDELYNRLQSGCLAAVANLGWGEPVHEMEVIYSRLAGRFGS